MHLPNGLTRQYSLCNDPGEGHRYLIGVLRDPASRGGSQAMHELVQEGDTLRISAPTNHFPLAHEAAHSLLLAGGIGVTPILCMAERLAVTGASFEMHYCTRSPERTAFRDRIAASSFAPRVHFHFDDGDAAQKLELDRAAGDGAPGHAPLRLRPEGLHGLGARRGARRRLAGRAAALRVLRRRSGQVGAGRRLRGQARQLGQGRRGAPRTQTVVQALAAAGVEIPTSCEQGVCGTCLTRVLEGEPDHKDMYLTPEEQAANDQFTPCCSRSKSPMLVLDL